MRWLICLVLLTATRDASAELVINDPPMVRKCPRAKTWDLVVSCLVKHGKPTVTRQVRGAKLVTFVQKQGARDVDTGVLLYVERRGEWQLGGRFETYGSEYSVLGLEPITVGKKTGYRLDIGQVSPFTYMVDGITPIPALLRLKRSLFCNGDSYHCPEATTQCEVTVQGRAWHAFRGSIGYEENVVNITGDRTRAGPNCNVQQKIYLGWP